ncbi:hemolysin family protein [Arachidicoccus sp.]|uniref:hemolysin family protein n=1 Tax=Arachidicoccus sp. TaxID=1872624 RepID=UPI003D1A3A03
MIADIPPAEHTAEIYKVFLTIFLVLLNGFFVAAEFAIVKVRSSQITSTKGVSPKLINVAKTVTSNLDNYLAATQLGITLASLGLGWVGESVMTAYVQKLFLLFNFPIAATSADKIAIVIAFILITILHIVFGELAPKSIAIRKAAPTTLLVALPLRAFYFVFRPFIFLLNTLANFVLRILGVDPIKDQDIHTEEEIKMIISESEEGGEIEDSERELINNVFDFDSSRVRDILTHRKDIVALDIDVSFDEIVKTVVEEGYSRYPVYRETLNDLVGILTIKDILQFVNAGKSGEIKKILRPVFYIPDSMKIKDLLRSFQKDHLQIAVVTDEYGDIAGIVTMEDILEELVGDIQDEHDAEQPIVEVQIDGSFLVQSHETIEDINEFLPLKLPEIDDYSTLSGLITYQHGSVPVEGEVLHSDGYEITILKMYRSSVEKVRMRLLPKENEVSKENNKIN